MPIKKETKSPKYCKYCGTGPFAWVNVPEHGWKLYPAVKDPVTGLFKADPKGEVHRCKVHPPTALPSPEEIAASAAVAEVTPTVAALPAELPKPLPLPTAKKLLTAAAFAAWDRAERAIQTKITPTRVLLWGPPGTGKTELPWRIAQRENWAHVYQLMTEETPGTELLGHLIVQAGNTVWSDGTLGRALRLSQEKPVVYVVDEIGRASQDAMSACLLALTNPESLRLVLRSGETLMPKPENWHVVCTSNDDPGQLPPALADRLHISVKVLSPHPGLIDSMTTIEARRLAASASREYSVRALLTYDKLVAGGMSKDEAAGIVWEPEVAKSFNDARRLEEAKAR